MPLTQTPPTPARSLTRGRTSPLVYVVAACVCFFFIIALSVCLALYCRRRRRLLCKQKSSSSVSHDVILRAGSAPYTATAPAAAAAAVMTPSGCGPSAVYNEHFLPDNTMSTTSSANRLDSEVLTRQQFRRPPGASSQDSSTRSLRHGGPLVAATAAAALPYSTSQRPSQRRIRLGTTALTSANRASAAFSCDALQLNNGNLSDHTYESIPAYGYRLPLHHQAATQYPTTGAVHFAAQAPPTLPRRPSDQLLQGHAASPNCLPVGGDHSRVHSTVSQVSAYNSDIERSLLPTHV